MLQERTVLLRLIQQAGGVTRGRDVLKHWLRTHAFGCSVPPGVGSAHLLFRVIDGGLLGSDESSSKCATREQPPELYAEEQKEAEDVTREIFVLLDNAASPSRVVNWNKIASVPRTAAIVVSARTSSARIGVTTGRWSGRSVFLVRHVLTPNTREVDASPAACDRESAATSVTLARALARSARSNM